MVPSDGSPRWSVFLVVLCQVVLMLSGARAEELTQENLRSIVKKQISSRPSEIERPEFKIDAIALYYDFGGLNRSTIMHDRTALQFPTDLQFKVELLRQYPWRAVNRRIWQPSLSKVEKVVARQLELIGARKDSEKELLRKLTDLEADGDSILGDAAEEMARREGRMLAPVGTVFREVVEWTPYGLRRTYVQERKTQGYLKGYKTAIKTVPSLGHVYYLAEADYEIAQEAGMVSQDSAWNSTSEGEHTLGGIFYFRARWQDGKNAKAERWIIESDRTITLTPD